MEHEKRGRDGAKALPFLLQHGKVFFEGRADLVEQLYQGMAEESGAGGLGVEVICRGPTEKTVTAQGAKSGCQRTWNGQELTGSGKSPV